MRKIQVNYSVSKTGVKQDKGICLSLPPRFPCVNYRRFSLLVKFRYSRIRASFFETISQGRGMSERYTGSYLQRTLVLSFIKITSITRVLSYFAATFKELVDVLVKVLPYLQLV